jgi:hypothetical protein
VTPSDDDSALHAVAERSQILPAGTEPSRIQGIKAKVPKKANVRVRGPRTHPTGTGLIGPRVGRRRTAAITLR